MGRRPKLYVPLSVTFFEDDRVIAAGDGATLLYLAMCLQCKALGSDGRLSDAQVARLHRPRWKTELRRLAELGLVVFDEAHAEWFVAAWFGHNDAISVVEERRAAERQRKAVSGRKSGVFQPEGETDSALKGSKGREGKESRESAHRFVDDGSSCCAVCSLPSSNQVHFQLLDGGIAG
jgi:hypothetical protein